MTSSNPSERRLFPRRAIDPEEQIHVDFAWPGLTGRRVTTCALDIGLQGASFGLSSDEGCPLPGTLLPDVRITHKGAPLLHASGEVMNTSRRLGEEPAQYRVGIRLTADAPGSPAGRRLALGRKSFPFRVRPMRTTTRCLHAPLLISAHVDSQAFRGEVSDFSPYGLRCQFENSNGGELRPDVVVRFAMSLEGVVVGSGNALVVRATPTGDRTEVGLSFTGSLLDVDGFSRAERVRAAVTEFRQRVESARHNTNNVVAPFKTTVADLRVVLDKTKAWLDREEERLNSLGRERGADEGKRLLDEVGVTVFEFFDSGLIYLNELTRAFDAERHASHREYFQAQLHPVFLLSPFVKRCFTKPLGYAGDYAMMDMIYRDPDSGDTLFARLMNRYACGHISAARASRNRIPYLLGHIKDVVGTASRASGRLPGIMSVGCGPANELADFLRTSNPEAGCRITILDVEPHALDASHHSLLSLKALNGHKAEIVAQHKPIKQLIQESRDPSRERYHLIYSAGLLEYLGGDVAKKLVEVLYDRLEDGGRLVVGNFDPSNEFRCFMEYVAEWVLIYRTKEEMLGWAADLRAVRKVTCEAEDTGINNFLVINK